MLLKDVIPLFPLKDRSLNLSRKIFNGIYVVVEKIIFMKPFLMLKNFGQNIIL